MSLNNMGINISINVNAPAAAQNAQQVAQALNQVAVAGTNAAKGAGSAKREFAQLAGAFVQMTVGKQLLGVFAGLAMKTDAITMGMQNIKTVMEDSFGPGEEQKLKNTLMTVAETTGKSFKDVAEATKNLIAQGLSPEQAETLVGPLMKFSAVGDISIQKSTDLAVALTNMGIGADSAGHAFDVMLNLSNKTSLATKDFVEVMTRVAPTASITGMSFNELAVTAAVMRKSFSSAREESTALARTMQFLERTKPQGKIRAAFGVDAIDHATGRLKPLLNLVQEIGGAMAKGKGGMSDIFDIFGGKSGAQVFAGGLSTLQQGMNVSGRQLAGQQLLDTMRAVPGQSGGAVDEAFSKKMEALTPQLERLKVAFDDLMGTVGTGFADSLTKAVMGLSDMFTSIRQFLTDNPKFAAGLSVIADHLIKIAAFVGVFAVMSGGFSILSTALTPVIMGFRRMTTSIIGVGVAGRTAGAAVGGLWRSLLGPLGLILLLVDLVPTLLKFFGIGDNMTDKSLEASKIIRDSALSNQGAANAMNLAAQSLADATKEYKELVVMYENLILKQAPKFDPRTENVISNALALWQNKTGAIPAAVVEQINKSIHDVFEYARKGVTAPVEVMDAATRSGQYLGSAAAYLEGLNTPGGKLMANQIRDFVRNEGIAASQPATQFNATDIAARAGRDITKPGMPFIDPAKAAQENEAKRIAAGDAAGIRAMSFTPNKMDPNDVVSKNHGRFTGNVVRVHRYDPIQLNVDGVGINGALKGVEQHEEVLETESP